MNSWRGTGAVIDGMRRQGFEAVLSGGPDGWWATFLLGREVGGAPEIVGSSHEATAWRAVQLAAWAALKERAVRSDRKALSG